MGDLRELTTDAKRLYEALDVLLTRQDEAAKDTADFKEIWRSAKSRSFTEHILVKEEEYTAVRYLKVLAGLIALSKDKENHLVQLRYLARILAACKNVNMELEAVVSEGMLLNEQSFDEIFAIENQDIKDSLVIDMLLMCGLHGSLEDIQLDYVTGFMSVLGLSREKTEAIGDIVKGILEQDDVLVMNQAQYTNIGIVYGIMKNPPDGILVADLDKAKSVKASKIIFSGISWEGIPVIYCDQFEAGEITFDGCTFKGVQGIRSITKKVHLKNCRFENCDVKETLLTLVNSTIEDCTFNNIKSFDSECSFIIQLKDSKMENTEFDNVCITTNNENRYGGFLRCLNSVIHKIKVHDISVAAKYGCRNLLDLEGGRLYESTFEDVDLTTPGTFFVRTWNNAIVENISTANINYASYSSSFESSYSSNQTNRQDNDMVFGNDFDAEEDSDAGTFRSIFGTIGVRD